MKMNERSSWVVALVGIPVAVVALASVLFFSFAGSAANLAPRNMPIGVVGGEGVADDFRVQLEGASGSGSFDVEAFQSREAAEQAVRDRDIYAALVPAPSGEAELLVASAASPTVAQLLERAAAPLDATVTDVVPAPAEDPRGAGLAGGSLPMTLCGIAIGSAAALLLRRRIKHQLVAVSIASIGVGAVGVAMIHGWLGSLDGDVWAEIGVLSLGIAAIAALALGVFAWFGRVGLILLDVILVVVGNPLSGANAAPELLPLGDLGRVLPLGAAVDALRGVFGFDGAGQRSHWSGSQAGLRSGSLWRSQLTSEANRPSSPSLIARPRKQARVMGEADPSRGRPFNALGDGPAAIRLSAAACIGADLNRPGVSGGFGRCLYPVGTRRFRAA